MNKFAAFQLLCGLWRDTASGLAERNPSVVFQYERDIFGVNIFCGSARRRSFRVSFLCLNDGYRSCLPLHATVMVKVRATETHPACELPKKDISSYLYEVFPNQWIGRGGIRNVTEDVEHEFFSKLLLCFPKGLAGGWLQVYHWISVSELIFQMLCIGRIFPVWPTSTNPTLRQRCFVRRVSGTFNGRWLMIAVITTVRKIDKNTLELRDGPYRSSRKRSSLYFISRTWYKFPGILYLVKSSNFVYNQVILTTLLLFPPSCRVPIFSALSSQIPSACVLSGNVKFQSHIKKEYKYSLF